MGQSQRSNRRGNRSARATSWLGAFLRDRRGNITPLMALMVLPLIGAIALASEVSGWYTTQRSMQNAADAAVVAAASNASLVAPTYQDEAKAVTTRFGYTNGVDSTTVTALNNQTCPAPSTNTDCYLVTITRDVTVGLVRAVGFAGNQNSGSKQRVTASAMAKPPASAGNFCMIGLSTTGDSKGNSFATSGTPSFDAGGCPVASNASANCNSSHDLDISSMSAVGSPDCATLSSNNLTMGSALADPYSSKSTATNIPPSTGCTNVTLAIPVSGKLDWDLSTNTSTNPKKLCGAPTITGTGVINVLTPPSTTPGAVVIVYGGASLTLPKGVTLQELSTGTGMTLIFSGTAGNNIPGFMLQASGGGGSAVFDWAGPTSGTWSGIAVYQDSRMTGVTDRVYSGSSPDFKFTGLVYAPYANMEIKGAINHQTNGLKCFGLVANTITIKGTGSIFNNPVSECAAAGLTTPPAPNLLARAALVK